MPSLPLQQLTKQLIEKVHLKAAKPSRKHFFGLHPAKPLQTSFTEDRGKFSNFVAVPSPYLIGENQLEPLKPTQFESAVYKQSLFKQLQKKQTRSVLKSWAKFEGVKKEEDLDELTDRLESQIRDQLEQEELKVQRMLKQLEPQRILPTVSNHSHRLHHIDNIEKLEYQVRDAQKRAAWRTERGAAEIRWATQELPKQVSAAIVPMKQFAGQIARSPRERALHLKSRFRQVFAKIYRLHKFGVSLDEVKRGKVFPKAPLSSELARAFLMAAKSGEADAVRRLLGRDRYLVHQFDSVLAVEAARPDGAALGREAKPVRVERGAAGERSRRARGRLPREKRVGLLQPK